MLLLIKNLIKNIKNKVSSYGSMTAEEFLRQLDGGNLKKRRGFMLSGARQKDGWSRRDAAIALKINPKELKAIEKGIKAPNKALVIKMAQVYNTPLNTLWKYTI